MKGGRSIKVASRSARTFSSPSCLAPHTSFHASSLQPQATQVFGSSFIGKGHWNLDVHQAIARSQGPSPLRLQLTIMAASTPRQLTLALIKPTVCSYQPDVSAVLKTIKRSPLQVCLPCTCRSSPTGDTSLLPLGMLTNHPRSRSHERSVSSGERRMQLDSTLSTRVDSTTIA